MEIVRPILAVLFGSLIVYLFLIALRTHPKNKQIGPWGWLALFAVFILVVLVLLHFGI